MSLVVNSSLDPIEVARHNLELIISINPSSSFLNTHLITKTALESFEEMDKHRLSQFYHFAKNGFSFLACAIPIGVGYELYKRISVLNSFELVGMATTFFLVKTGMNVLAPSLNLDAYNALSFMTSKLSEKVINFKKLEDEEKRSLEFYKDQIIKNLTECYDQIAESLQKQLDEKKNHPKEMADLKKKVKLLNVKMPYVRRAITSLDVSCYSVTKKLNGVIKAIREHELKLICGFPEYNISLLTQLDAEDFVKGCIPKGHFISLRETEKIPYSIRKTALIAIPLLASAIGWMLNQNSTRNEMIAYAIVTAVVFGSSSLRYCYCRNRHEFCKYSKEVVLKQTKVVYQEMAEHLKEQDGLLGELKNKMPQISLELSKYGLKESIAPLEELVLNHHVLRD